MICSNYSVERNDAHCQLLYSYHITFVPSEYFCIYPFLFLNYDAYAKFCEKLSIFHFFFDCKVTDNIKPSFIDLMKTKYPHFNQLDSLENLKIILNSDKEILPSVCNFIKRSLEVRI